MSAVELKTTDNKLTGAQSSGAVVEEKPHDRPDGIDPRPHHIRLRQQEILAELGVIALQRGGLSELLDQAARLTAKGLEAEFCKILEYQPRDQRFLVTAGIGWGPDVIGVATVEADIESPAGFALLTGKPVISNHLENEQRFRTPKLLAEHGVRRAMNVILQGNGSPYGVLEVDSRSDGEFSVQDIPFLQGAASILGMAIEHQRIEQQLRLAAERNQLLLKEVNHRVNNSLAIVASMLHLKATTVNEEVRAHLDEASRRITAIAGAHKRLYQVESLERLDLGAYLEDLCNRLSESVNGCVIHVSAPAGIDVLPDQAVPIALCVNELITNSAKYGYPKTHCEVWITISRAPAPGNIVSISVRDKGIGLPSNFDPAAHKGLGMRLVTAFTKQLDGTLEIRRNDPGAEFVISFPGGG